MIAVLQRVSEASVRIDGNIKGQIGLGLMILVGIEEADSPEDILWLSKKIVNMRIFPDQDDVMNESLIDAGDDFALSSQFYFDKLVPKRQQTLIYQSSQARDRYSSLRRVDQATFHGARKVIFKQAYSELI